MVKFIVVIDFLTKPFTMKRILKKGAAASLSCFFLLISFSFIQPAQSVSSNIPANVKAPIFTGSITVYSDVYSEHIRFEFQYNPVTDVEIITSVTEVISGMPIAPHPYYAYTGDFFINGVNQLEVDGFLWEFINDAGYDYVLYSGVIGPL